MEQLRAEVKLLIAKGKITPIQGLDDLSAETLTELISEYRNEKNKQVNNTICVGLVNGLTLLCKKTNLVHEEIADSLRDELLGNEPFMTCASSFISCVTPCVPYIGLCVGGIIIAKYVFDGVVKAKQATQTPE